MKTQTQMVKDHLESGKTLTSLDAANFFGITRLAARCHDLKKEGLPIQSKTVTVKNRFGQNVTVSEYSIINNITQQEMRI